MGSGINRTQILRRDCTTCHGKGYIDTPTGQESCEPCGGSGMLEKEVDYKFENNGKWSSEEQAQAWGIPVEEFKDSGHSAGD